MQFYNNLFTKKYLLSLAGICWAGVGFNRGIEEYDYKHKYNEYYKKKYLHTDRFCSGFFVSILYVNPAFLPFIIYKEIYRLEVNYRGLEDEKNSDYYNKIFI